MVKPLNDMLTQTNVERRLHILDAILSTMSVALMPLGLPSLVDVHNFDDVSIKARFKLSNVSLTPSFESAQLGTGYRD